MNRVRLYLDTSVISHLQAEDTPETTESIELAEKYIQHGVLSPKSRDDCLHIAIATLANCKYNYEKTKNMTPEELIENTKRQAEIGKKMLEAIRSKTKNASGR